MEKSPTPTDEQHQEEDQKPEASSLSSPSKGESQSPSVPEIEQGEEEKVVKKRTWKKPKDKPKRPLSAYNIFFQHARSRIVQGQAEEEEATREEITRSIEGILSKSREKKRPHRKSSHGKISFGDLARAIAEQWKNIRPENREIFDHYAKLDMLRYRKEVKIWKERKEMESDANAMEKHKSFINQVMGTSFNSTVSSSSAGADADADADDKDCRLDDDDRMLLHDERGDRTDPSRAMEGSSPFVFSSSSAAITGREDSSYAPSHDISKKKRPEIQMTYSDNMRSIIQRQQHLLRQQLQAESNDFMATNVDDDDRNDRRGQLQQRHQLQQQQHQKRHLPDPQMIHQSAVGARSGLESVPEQGIPQQQSPAETMHALKMQQQRQLAQMRELELHERQLQHQLQMQRMKQRQLQQQEQAMQQQRQHRQFSDYHFQQQQQQEQQHRGVGMSSTSSPSLPSTSFTDSALFSDLHIDLTGGGGGGGATGTTTAPLHDAPSMAMIHDDGSGGDGAGFFPPLSSTLLSSSSFGLGGGQQQQQQQTVVPPVAGEFGYQHPYAGTSGDLIQQQQLQQQLQQQQQQLRQQQQQQQQQMMMMQHQRQQQQQQQRGQRGRAGQQQQRTGNQRLQPAPRGGGRDGGY